MKDLVVETRPDGTVNCFSRGKLWKRLEKDSSYTWERISMSDPTRPPDLVSDKTAEKLEHSFKTQSPVKIRRFSRDIPPKGTKYHKYKSGNVDIWLMGKRYKGYKSERYDVYSGGNPTISYGFVEVDEESFESNQAVRSPLDERLESIRQYYERESGSLAKPARHQDDVESDGSRGSNSVAVKRTKHGVMVPSNDGRHSFGIGVWKSTKYEGRTTICLFVAGRRFLYTVDKEHMAALRNEVARGEPT